MKYVGWFFLIVLGFIVLSVSGFGLHMCGAVSTNVHSAIDVVQEQTEAHELLRKYEWFKDASAQLDKKKADIAVYQARFQALKDAYPNNPRSEWSREDREQTNIWEGEVAGVEASYNALAADYNAAMAKINYRFCNVGTLPKGADQPLPREYKPYDYGR
jgi:hypothetical protein